MRRCTCIVMALAMVAVVGGAASAAEVYWDGDTGTDFFDVTNWSTTRPANSDPLAVPGPGDTVVWARDAAVANRPYFGASVSFDAYVRDTSAADFAWNNGPAGTVVELLGADYDLAPIGGWGLTPDVVVAANGGMAFASNIELSLAGGNNVFYAANGWMEIQGNISETAPSDLQKLGYARTQFRGDFGLSGNIWLRQGELSSTTAWTSPAPAEPSRFRLTPRAASSPSYSAGARITCSPARISRVRRWPRAPIRRRIWTAWASARSLGRATERTGPSPSSPNRRPWPCWA